MSKEERIKKKIHSESEMVKAVKEHESGVDAETVAREHGISRATLYNWKSKYSGMDVSQVKCLKELEEENRKLKQMYADLALDNRILREAEWDPSGIIDSSVLEPWESFVALYHYADPTLAPECDLTFFYYNYEKTYVYSRPNRLRLVLRRIGRADPDYTGHPNTIRY